MSIRQVFLIRAASENIHLAGVRISSHNPALIFGKCIHRQLMELYDQHEVTERSQRSIKATLPTQT